MTSNISSLTHKRSATLETTDAPSKKLSRVESSALNTFATVSFGQESSQSNQSYRTEVTLCGTPLANQSTNFVSNSPPHLSGAVNLMPTFHNAPPIPNHSITQSSNIFQATFKPFSGPLIHQLPPFAPPSLSKIMQSNFFPSIAMPCQSFLPTVTPLQQFAPATALHSSCCSSASPSSSNQSMTNQLTSQNTFVKLIQDSIQLAISSPCVNKLNLFTQVHKSITQELINELIKQNSPGDVDKIVKLLESLLPNENNEPSESDFQVFWKYLIYTKSKSTDYKYLTDRVNKWVDRYRDPKTKFHTQTYKLAAAFHCLCEEFTEAEKLLATIDRENSVRHAAEQRMEVVKSIRDAFPTEKSLLQLEAALKILAPPLDNFDLYDEVLQVELLSIYKTLVEGYNLQINHLQGDTLSIRQAHSDYWGFVSNMIFAHACLGQYDDIIKYKVDLLKKFPIGNFGKILCELVSIFISSGTETSFMQQALDSVVKLIGDPNKNSRVKYNILKKFCEKLVIQGTKTDLIKSIVSKCLGIPDLSDQQRSELLDFFEVRSSIISS